MNLDLSGKVAIITGASRGIGRAIAETLAGERMRLVLVARSHDLLEGLAGQLATECVVQAVDLRQAEAAAAVVNATTARFGQIDVLVNNAGATVRGDFLTLTKAQWADGFALKFFGAVRLTRLFWPLLKTTHGHLLNIIGTAARTAEPEFLITGSVNAASANFTKGLSKLGMRDGVHVNAIHPGLNATDRVEQLIEQRATAAGKSPDAMRAEMLEKSGTSRMASVEDIAQLAVFLCSERTRHIQGIAVAVDGGATPGVY